MARTKKRKQPASLKRNPRKAHRKPAAPTAFKRRMRKRHRRPAPDYTPNPGGSMSDLSELAIDAGAGFAAFAASRLLTRIASVQIEQRKPKWGKHAGAVAALAQVGLAYYAAPKVRSVAAYQVPIVLGTALAAAQSIIQLYIPKLAWMVSDASPELAETAGAVQALPASSGPVVRNIRPQLDPAYEVLDEDPDAYTFTDDFDAGRLVGSSTPPTANAAGADPMINDDLSLEDLDFGSLSPR